MSQFINAADARRMSDEVNKAKESAHEWVGNRFDELMEQAIKCGKYFVASACLQDIPEYAIPMFVKHVEADLVPDGFTVERNNNEIVVSW